MSGGWISVSTIEKVQGGEKHWRDMQKSRGLLQAEFVG
jgi:hypothetical protein